MEVKLASVSSKVTFSETVEQFADIEAEKNIEDIIFKAVMPAPSAEYDSDNSGLPPCEQSDTNKGE